MVCWDLAGCISIETSCNGARSAPMEVDCGRFVRNEERCCSMDAPSHSVHPNWIASDVSNGVALMEHHDHYSSFPAGPMRRSWYPCMQGRPDTHAISSIKNPIQPRLDLATMPDRAEISFPKSTNSGKEERHCLSIIVNISDLTRTAKYTSHKCSNIIIFALIPRFGKLFKKKITK